MHTPQAGAPYLGNRELKQNASTFHMSKVTWGEIPLDYVQAKRRPDGTCYVIYNLQRHACGCVVLCGDDKTHAIDAYQ